MDGTLFITQEALDTAIFCMTVGCMKITAGLIDPVNCFCGCSADELEQKERALLKECGAYSNFVLSTGCDLPPKAKWENIQRFFRTLEQVNSERRLPYGM